MNPYETKRAARIDRMRGRAENKRIEAANAAESVHGMAECMNGTPVLIGHHSERRHRRDLDRMDRNLAKSVEATREAEELERRADRAEASTAVSSDDPDAVAKLRAKVDVIDAELEMAGKINKAIRSAKGDIETMRTNLAALGLRPATIDAAVEVDPMGNRGVPAYRTANLRGERARLVKRMADLEAKATATPREQTIGAVRIVEQDNRCRLYFPAKPSADTIATLKSRGFRWSPSEGAWQRMQSEGAWYAAEQIARGLASAPESAA